MHRMATLRALRKQVGDGESPDWEGIAGLIDESGANPSVLRHSMHEDAPLQAGAERAEIRPVAGPHRRGARPHGRRGLAG